MLGEVLRLYCQELFPGELEHFSVEMQDMLMRGSMAEDNFTAAQIVKTIWEVF